MQKHQVPTATVTCSATSTVEGMHAQPEDFAHQSFSTNAVQSVDPLEDANFHSITMKAGLKLWTN